MRDYLLGITMGAWLAALCLRVTENHESQLAVFALMLALVVIPAWLLGSALNTHVIRPLTRRLDRWAGRDPNRENV